MSTTSTRIDFIQELAWRGLLHQKTAERELEAHLAAPGRVAYCGFDPTADSLTIGHLIQAKLLMHWQQAGHKPIVLIGGGTGLIGDPSGKDAERQLLTREQVEANVAGQRKIMERLLDFDPRNPNAAVMVNNADWLCDLKFIDVLRDVGKHFSVNVMIQKDSVKERLHGREQGISYTEFSYMILQAYDFLHLKRTHNCTVQTAGSDQFGNIVAGIDLIRREFGPDQAFGVTSVLVKRADGKKIGKTEKGAVWLSPDRTSPYAFYQYWINVDDQDVIPFLKWFTMKGREEIEGIASQHERAPHERNAQRELARTMTRMIHGEDNLRHVEAATAALFSGDVRGLGAAILHQILADIPHKQLSREQVIGQSFVDLLVETEVAQSKRQAREFIQQGAIAASGVQITDPMAVVEDRYILEPHTILIRRGKKNWYGIDLVDMPAEDIF